MTQLPFSTYDVFTDTPYTGNPLAIVEQAGDLTTAQMQTVAREFNLSETIFVRPAVDPAHTAEVRIFFPTAEIPFAGHPTIGCAIHLARAGQTGPSWSTRITLEEQAGLVPVKVACNDGEITAQFVAPVIPHAPKDRNLPDSASLIEITANALGLAPDDIDADAHAPRVWSGGPTFFYARLTSRAALSSARVSGPAWETLCLTTGCDNIYVYVTDADDIHSRMFAPGAGIPEDPATGSASAILAAQLLAAGALQTGTNTRHLIQGTDMGRPSRIGLEVDVSGGAITEVRISGTAVPISSGQITIPA